MPIDPQDPDGADWALRGTALEDLVTRLTTPPAQSTLPLWLRNETTVRVGGAFTATVPATVTFTPIVDRCVDCGAPAAARYGEQENLCYDCSRRCACPRCREARSGRYARGESVYSQGCGADCRGGISAYDGMAGITHDRLPNDRYCHACRVRLDERTARQRTCLHCEQLQPTQTSMVSIANVLGQLRSDGCHHVCEPCFDAHWTECFECTELYPIMLDDTVAPHACVEEECEDCEQEYYVRVGHSYCDGMECEECGGQYYPSRGACSCLTDHRRLGLHDYSYKPSPIFYGSIDERLFFGLELELEFNYMFADGQFRNAIKAASDMLTQRRREIGYLKTDGSLSCGFEIVTHPMTHEWAMTKFPWHKLAALAGDGMGAKETCGLHIHASRTGFSSESHQYHWIQLWYRNQEMITRLARRESEEYAAYDVYDRMAAKRVIKHKGCIQPSGRYVAINTQNYDTYEVRVFASSLNPVQIKAALDLVHATIEYARSITSADVLRKAAWGWPAFAKWVRKHSDTYPSLLSEMERLQCAC